MFVLMSNKVGKDIGQSETFQDIQKKPKTECEHSSIEQSRKDIWSSHPSRDHLSGGGNGEAICQHERFPGTE